jgi:hypothetical protein
LEWLLGPLIGHAHRIEHQASAPGVAALALSQADLQAWVKSGVPAAKEVDRAYRRRKLSERLVKLDNERKDVLHQLAELEREP